MKICIVEDQAILREALVRLLHQSDLNAEIHSAENGNEAYEIIRDHKPDIVLMDINMPGESGIEVTRKIAPELSKVRIIAFSEYEDLEYLRGMVVAGAVGYITKQTMFEDLIHGIKEVAKGGYYFSQSMIFLLLQDYLSLLTEYEQTVFHQLTLRELDVLKGLSNGKTSAEIAKDLNVSTKTVMNQRQSLMDKLDIHNIAGLTKYAMKQGIL